MKDMRLIGLREFLWDNGFPGLGTKTTLMMPPTNGNIS